jgi:DNA-binding NarL/FixJ family response regulator
MGSVDSASGATKTVSVLIVDDQMPFRAVARTVIGMTAGFEVAAEAASGEEAIAEVDAHPPDLVLMDINLPGVSGIEATCEIRSRHPDVAVILLSTYSEADLPADARECGALAYVHKEDFGPALVRQLWDGRSSKA